MRKLTVLLLIINCAVMSAQNSVDDIMAKAQAHMNTVVSKANKEQSKILTTVENEHSRMMARYNAYCERIMGMWGDRSMVESSKKEWVEYSDNDSSRSIVDFENGDVTVEVLVNPYEKEAVVNKKLEEAVDNLLTSKGTTPEYISESAVKEEVAQKPILDNQLDISKMVIESEKKTVAEAIVAEEKKEVKTVNTDQGRKQVVSIRLKLVEDHIPRRAEQFKGIIARYAGRFDVDEPLIYAVIEQESAFNPMARSFANAYGLMQIVPSSGGLDANRYVNSIDKEPEAEELYDPDFNILLGVGYLKKQMEVYFRGVKDRKSVMLCAIAAYNTGQNNVYYAFTGKRNPNGVPAIVNSMSYEQLYEYLKSHLHHPETRDYIQKVTSKMLKYIE